ncbi:helicase [Tanacetum coccineum]
MMQNYQDAMALCQAYGNPDLFITFTSNPKFSKIGELLAFIPGQKPYERPEVGTRVFKMKLTHLLDDLTKNDFFVKTYAFVYVIEFQKRGLPHAHILLWLEEEWKFKTPNQVDDIISMELPSPTTDPEGYKVVTEFMLHGPCGKGAACIVEGKGTEKTFLYKTIISRLRSERLYVLAVASSGIASLLLPVGQTAHSDFVIPLELVENVGDGTVEAKKKEDEDEPTWIEIPEDFIINAAESPIEQIVNETFPDFTTRKTDSAYLKE